MTIFWPLNPPELAQPLPERVEQGRPIGSGRHPKITYPRHLFRLLLCTHIHGARDRTTNKRNELPPPHSNPLIQDDETRISDDLAQSAQAFAASRLRVPNWVKPCRSRRSLSTSEIPRIADESLRRGERAISAIFRPFLAGWDIAVVSLAQGPPATMQRWVGSASSSPSPAVPAAGCQSSCR